MVIEPAIAYHDRNQDNHNQNREYEQTTVLREPGFF